MDFSLKPIICFFENNQSIYSQDYSIHECPDSISTDDFLSAIEAHFFNQMKVVQINFDAFENESNSKSLYPNKKATVFVLNQYHLIELQQNNSPELPPNTFQLLISKKEFIEKVQQIKKMISLGRFYQMNLTCALKGNTFGDSEQFFLNNHHLYAGQYKCYLPFQNYSISSFSPELFLFKKDNLLSTQPIKGSLAKNQQLDFGLMKNKKEQAELSMIVDLLRNDLNSLETKSSAKVTKHRELMDLNYIQHTYSEVQIETNQTLPIVLKKTMPGGSISGCPKQESLKAIRELENYNRNAYTGSIGWWQKNDFKLNIAIRTFIEANNHCYYFAGCGIVYDSDPEKEFEELLNKTGKLNVIYT